MTDPNDLGVFGFDPKSISIRINNPFIGEVEPDPGKDDFMDVMLHGYCDASATEVEPAVVLIQLHEDSEPLLMCAHHWDYEHGAAIMALDPFLVVDTRV